jgi:hypothetical protein
MHRHAFALLFAAFVTIGLLDAPPAEALLAGVGDVLLPVPGLVGVSVVGLAFGAYEISHGIWSIGRIHHARAPRPPAVCAAPMADGVMLTLRGEM